HPGTRFVMMGATCLSTVPPPTRAPTGATGAQVDERDHGPGPRGPRIAVLLLLILSAASLLLIVVPGLALPVRIALAAVALTGAIAGLAARYVAAARERTERYRR